MKTAIITVRMTNEEKEELFKLAKTKGVSPSQYVRNELNLNKKEEDENGKHYD